MKRGNLLRIVTSVAIAMFVAYGAYGQQIDANLTADETADQYVTIDKALPYHVTPDPYFNPNYDAGGGWVVTSDFLWSFSTVLDHHFHKRRRDAGRPETINRGLERSKQVLELSLQDFLVILAFSLAGYTRINGF